MFIWNHTALAESLDARLQLVPADLSQELTRNWFDPVYLAPGRVLNVLVSTVVAFALVSALWRPLDRLLGWFFVPLRLAVLYVLSMYIAVVIVTSNVPVLQEHTLLLNALVAVTGLGLLWPTVRSKFLFRLLPH